VLNIELWEEMYLEKNVNELYQPTLTLSWSWALLEKLPIVQPIRTVSAIYK
jgi:hypothetical protein